MKGRICYPIFLLISKIQEKSAEDTDKTEESAGDKEKSDETVDDDKTDVTIKENGHVEDGSGDQPCEQVVTDEDNNKTDDDKTDEIVVVETTDETTDDMKDDKKDDDEVDDSDKTEETTQDTAESEEVYTKACTVFLLRLRTNHRWVIVRQHLIGWRT